MKEWGKEGIALTLIVIALLILVSGVGVAAAQPNVVTLSDPIKINADPASIPADGITTSMIMISDFLPEIEELGNLSGPAANTMIEVWTNLCTLTDGQNESNSGSEITLLTDDNGTAIVLLSGEEVGEANITVRAPGIEGVVNSILGILVINY